MKYKSIHFVGIKGVGMTPLAIIAKEAGLKISGCDIEEEFITDEPLKRAGITPLVNFAVDHVKNIDLLITTGAHGGFENKEVKRARKLGIPVWTQGQAVGEFMNGEIFERNFAGISIAGSHGKTTTAAMIATILKENKLDPTFLIGTSSIPSLGNPGHYGKGKYFVAEADEYATEPVVDKTPKFLWQHPKIIVFTNIEFDHSDVYFSIDQIRDAFMQFAQNLPADGVLIVCGDDPQVRKILNDYQGRIITYGVFPDNDFVLSKVSVSGSKTFFWAQTKNISMGEFALNVVGEHNALNALCAAIAATESGLSPAEIKKGLLAYSGCKRRFEYLGRMSSGALIFDDYAHHPTEIKKTLKAARQSFTKANIVCIFQPHTYSRTKSLLDQFIYSFNDANVVILTNIYPSLREKVDLDISSGRLVEKMNVSGRQVLFLPELEDVVKYITQKQYGGDSIIITMGAGDVYKVGEKLVSKIKI